MTWALHTSLSLDDANLHLAAFEQAGLLGIAEQDGRATVYLAERPDGLGVEGAWEEVPERDWNEVWKAGMDPVAVGAITVAPPWLAEGATLVIDPGQAFGTGHHETTTACLAALQRHDLAGRRVMDVGTGTGVLAIAARQLGAAAVVAVDNDPLAVAAARDNAARNGVSIDVRQGSADAVDGVFDVVVANLDTATLTALAPELATAITPGGVLLASGVSLEREDEAVQALRAVGLAPQVQRGTAWVLIEAR